MSKKKSKIRKIPIQNRIRSYMWENFWTGVKSVVSPSRLTEIPRVKPPSRTIIMVKDLCKEGGEIISDDNI